MPVDEGFRKSLVGKSNAADERLFDDFDRAIQFSFEKFSPQAFL
jgi:hypothetical protein